MVYKKLILLCAGASESTGAAFGVIQFGNFRKNTAPDGREDHLRDAFAGADGIRFRRQIDEPDLDFTAVVRVDDTDTVHERNAVPDGKSAAEIGAKEGVSVVEIAASVLMANDVPFVKFHARPLPNSPLRPASSSEPASVPK